MTIFYVFTMKLDPYGGRLKVGIVHSVEAGATPR